MANESIVESSLSYLSSTVSPFIIKLIIAIVILLIGFIIGRVVGKLVYRMLHEFELNKVLGKARIRLNLEDIIRHFVTYVIYFIAIIWALSEIGLSTLILSIILAAVIIITIVAIILGIKDFIPNAFAGLSIHKKGAIEEGDYIKINSVAGKVKRISLSETEIEAKNKEIMIVPNMNFKKQAVLIRKKRKA